MQESKGDSLENNSNDPLTNFASYFWKHFSENLQVLVPKTGMLPPGDTTVTSLYL